MQSHYYKISISIDNEDDIYHAHSPELTGCYTQGDSYEEVKEKIQEAVNLYLGTFTEEEAISYFEKQPAKQRSVNEDSDIQLRLTAPQAEKLLQEAGFKQAGNKENHRAYAKNMQRVVLPLNSNKVLSRQMAQEILDMVGGKL